MATRKQKHAAALAKREAYLEEMRRSGLEAQKRDKIERTQELMKAQEKWHEKHNKFEPDCLHCDIIKKALAKGEDPRPKYKPKTVRPKKGAFSSKRGTSRTDVKPANNPFLDRDPDHDPVYVRSQTHGEHEDVMEASSV